MIVHVRVHALVSLAASAAWPDKKREPNRRQTTNRQTGVFYIYTSVFLFVKKRSEEYITCEVLVRSGIRRHSDPSAQGYSITHCGVRTNFELFALQGLYRDVTPMGTAVVERGRG